MTTQWIAVASTKDLTRRRKLRVEVDGRAIALFEAAGRVYAFADSCIHQDRSLAKGTLLHGKVICPGHQWQFDLETGYEESQDLCQPTYPVRVEGETIYVNLTAPLGAVTAGREAQA
ncbi:nitrite reductase (NADH) small subunit [Mycobacterium frederiksbergense]|uniref:Nitrite reductase (NADH) small subunit n=1 Tax=Mycolicibacterium frederiksbergense TaxID=117567 RepID=A0ABT6L4K2_9MYCO|nr:Rieske (2Fe-2S) protein [Mycolicibacterium frederiksbergense]MDH6197854.1 nitrite reductase (NADH) small subunit [Mycolicibacterium frederiksbergense]